MSFRIRNFIIFFIVGGTLAVCFFAFDTLFKDSFRTTHDKISNTQINSQGLSKLSASGGDLPRFLSLWLKLSFYADKPVLIVNAESEPVNYANGIPMPILGYSDKPLQTKHYLRRLFFTGATEVAPSSVKSEADEAKHYNLEYINLPIFSRTITPDENIDQFVKLIDEHQKDTWFHFHCHHGLGRTTLMMAMYDILVNAPLVSLDDILKRQHALGGTDLLNTVVWRDKIGSYTQQQLENRNNFIRKFYAFVVQRKSGGMQRWSDWNQKNS